MCLFNHLIGLVCLLIYLVQISSLSIDEVSVSDSTPQPGSRVEFCCQVSSIEDNINRTDNTVNIIWTKDGGNLTLNGDIISSTLNNRSSIEFTNFNNGSSKESSFSRLVIYSMSNNDSGDYFCTAWTSGNTTMTAVTSSLVQVNVERYPQCLPGGKIRVRIGKPVTLTCLAQKRNPSVILSWLSWERGQFESSQGKNVPSSSQARSDGLIESSFKFMPSLDYRNAIYVCKIVRIDPYLHDIGECMINTTVIFPSPVVTIHPQDAIVEWNTSVEYTCVTSVMSDQMEWQYDASIEQSKVTITGSKLVIANVSAMENVTSISCIALIDGRLYEASATLTVIKPEMHVTNTATELSSTVVTDIIFTNMTTDVNASVMKSLKTSEGQITKASVSISGKPDQNAQTVTENPLDRETFLAVFFAVTVFAFMVLLLLSFMVYRSRRAKNSSGRTLDSHSITQSSTEPPEMIQFTPRRHTTEGTQTEHDYVSLDLVDFETQANTEANGERYQHLTTRVNRVMPNGILPSGGEVSFAAGRASERMVEIGVDNEGFLDSISEEDSPGEDYENDGDINAAGEKSDNAKVKGDAKFTKRVRFADDVDTISEDSIYAEIKEFMEPGVDDHL